MTDRRPDFSFASPRLLFPIVGLIQGIALYVLDELDTLVHSPVPGVRLPEAPAEAFGVGLNLALYLAPWLALLAWRAGRTAEVAVWGLGTGFVLAALGAWSALRFGDLKGDALEILIVAGIVTAVIAFAFLERRIADQSDGPQDLNGIAVALKTFVIGWAFAGILFLVLQLWGALFELIGIGRPNVGSLCSSLSRSAIRQAMRSHFRSPPIIRSPTDRPLTRSPCALIRPERRSAINAAQ